MCVVIRNDKVIKNHKPAQFELSNELNNVINDSLEAFPRKFILSIQRDGRKPIQKQGFESLLKQCFSPQRVTVDILRSAYITQFYSDPRKTLKDKDELARLMRHSSKFAEREYNKIDLGNVPDPLVVTSTTFFKMIGTLAPFPSFFVNVVLTERNVVVDFPILVPR